MLIREILKMLGISVCLSLSAVVEAQDKMQLLTIAQSHHEILRKHAKPVTFPLSEKTQQFISEFQEFFNTLETPQAKPAGLAAPQVGISKQIVMIQVPETAKKISRYAHETFPRTLFINPSYTPIVKDGKNKDWEGCYSVPNKMGEVYRYNTIKYQVYTLNGKKVSGVAKGYLARVFQHEIGHLNGELYIDLLCADCRIGPIEKMREIRKREMGYQGY